jgi:hypothetical protein
MFAREQERRVRKLSMKGWGLGEGVGRRQIGVWPAEGTAHQALPQVSSSYFCLGPWAFAHWPGMPWGKWWVLSLFAVVGHFPWVCL